MIGITGSTGFIGSYLCEKLPYPQKRLVRQAVYDPLLNCEFFEGDLLNPEDIQEFVKNLSVLIHLGHVGHPRSSNQNIPYDIQQNLASTAHLFESFAKANPTGHIIFTSTGGNIYAPQEKRLPFDEDQPVHPFTSYSILKLSSEYYLKMFCRLYGISATILRISNPYGLILNSNRAHGLIGVAYSKILQNETFEYVDCPSTTRDYIHLDDLAEVFQKAIIHSALPNQCRLYNVGSGQGYTITEVLELIEKITGKNLQKTYSTHFNPSLAPSWNVLSTDKLAQELDWTAKISLEEGLTKMWEQKDALFFQKAFCEKT